ncbi:MAG TPA: EutN/CcmL family microcompartment protein [Candidatus Ozemobacteraceae bacterium]|nr:EutN/CcmL family microcompartment protein [Candidatus Ozemobacteraceae bacterium]
MQIAKVVKRVVSTVKNRAFDQKPLLLVQPLDISLQHKGAEVLAIDFMGVDQGEIVLLMKEGSSVQQMLGNKDAPADAAIVGVIDTIDCDDRTVFEKYPSNPD